MLALFTENAVYRATSEEEAARYLADAWGAGEDHMWGHNVSVEQQARIVQLAQALITEHSCA